MKSIGVVRKIDKLGRIVLPKEVRDIQGWGVGQDMEMFMDGGRLVLAAYENDSKKDVVISQLNILLVSENEAIRTIAQNALDLIGNKKA